MKENPQRDLIKKKLLSVVAKDRKPKVPKIKIPDVDLKSFLLKDLQIDPYWNDLLDGPKRNARKTRESN